jgi:hypothetical protein
LLVLEIAQGVTAIGVIFAIAWFWSTLVHPLLGRILSFVWTAVSATFSWLLARIGAPLARSVVAGASALAGAAAGAVAASQPVDAAASAPEGTTETSPRGIVDGLAEPLSRERQWDRVSSVVKDASTRVEAIQTLQRSAEQQLDAATYAVQRLFDELAGIMSVPMQAAEALPHERSVVLKLNPLAAPHDATGSALAA